MASLSSLFPTPGLSPSVLSPSRFPGVSSESSIALQTVLKDNHIKWHIFYNERRFHNHAAHRAIGVWALGANGSVIHAGYKKDIDYEKPAFKSPEEISLQNFGEHLGDDKYYNAYINFFTCYVQEKGIPGALEHFIFSPKANLGTDAHLPIDKQPQMLNRFFAGVLHPLIHTGYGAEFNLPGMIVEGLALTAVENASADILGPLIFSEVKQATNKETTGEAIGNIHALSILARIMHDSQFDTPSTTNLNDEADTYNSTIEKYGNGIAEHVRAWTIDVSKLSEGDVGELNQKLEEVAWVVCILYGIGGWTGRQGGSGGQFNADFFLMHLVTSSIFLPSLCAFLSPSSKARLLRGYFATVCMWYVDRGRPALDIAGFFSQEISLPSGLDLDPRKVGIPNLWIPLLQSGMTHPDEHLVKIQRALSCWAQKFGVKRARVPIKGDPEGYAGLVSKAKSSSGGDADATSGNTVDTMPITELPGSEHLDGTLFLRTGLLTATRLGWVREGQKLDEWDFTGFFRGESGKD